MKAFAGWAVMAGLVLAASAANAQMLAPYRTISDLDTPYGYGAMPPTPYPAMPPAPYVAVPPAPAPEGYPPPEVYAPPMLPPREVYAILRANGFQPLGVPRQRGVLYTISAINPDGEDGRLVIDARDGRILRFVPAYAMGREFDEEVGPGYGPHGALPGPTMVWGAPRPPAPIPHVASRSVPLPTPKPAVAATRPAEPAQRSAAVQARPADAIAGEVKPATPQIRPTQDMPPVQALE